MFLFTLAFLLGSLPFPFEEPLKPPRPVQSIAHRGLWRAAPENTRPALELCVDQFIEWAEVDVRVTRDGKHVLLHDARLDGVTGGKGLVRDLTLAEFEKLDAGTPFARRFAGTPPLSLKAALELAKGRLNLYLDCKEVIPATLIREIRDAGMERQVVIHAKSDILDQIQANIGTGPPIALIKKWQPEEGTAGLAFSASLVAVEIDADSVTPEACRIAHRLGLKVQADAIGSTSDEPKTWARLADAGVDWIQTDWPLELQSTLQRRPRMARPIALSAHRGASRQAPENTLASIEAAIAMGTDFVELDVRTTKDGRLVLLHDSTLDRTTDGKGPVADANFEDVRKLDAGSWFGVLYRGAQVPTLDEAFDALKGRASQYLDAKAIAPETISATIRRHGTLQSTVVYGHRDDLKRLMEVDREVKRMVALRRPDDLEGLARDLEPYAFDVEWSILTRELVVRCHARGIKVYSDALGRFESLEDYRKAIDMGVDLIQTDHPERVLRAIELRGNLTPPR